MQGGSAKQPVPFSFHVRAAGMDCTCLPDRHTSSLPSHGVAMAVVQFTRRERHETRPDHQPAGDRGGAVHPAPFAQVGRRADRACMPATRRVADGHALDPASACRPARPRPIVRAPQSDTRTRMSGSWTGRRHGLGEVLGVIWPAAHGPRPVRDRLSGWHRRSGTPALPRKPCAPWSRPTPSNARPCLPRSFRTIPASARVLTNAGFDYLGDAEAYSSRAAPRCRPGPTQEADVNR